MTTDGGGGGGSTLPGVGIFSKSSIAKVSLTEVPAPVILMIGVEILQLIQVLSEGKYQSKEARILARDPHKGILVKGSSHMILTKDPCKVSSQTLLSNLIYLSPCCCKNCPRKI